MLYLDAHAHVYPDFPVERCLGGLLCHAEIFAPGVPVAMVLLARQGLPDVWEHWRSAGRSGEWTFTPAPGRLPALDAHGGARRLRVYPGRQMVSAERLEFAAIGVNTPLPDGLPLDRGMAEIRALDGFPVLCWGAGKWLGRRGQVVADWVDRVEPGTAGLCDTAMRPRGWPAPAAFATARRRGLPVLAGSDPMPWVGDAAAAGRYALCVEHQGECPPDTEALIRCLQDPATTLQPVGRRLKPCAWLLRQAQALRRKRKSVAPNL